MVMVVAEMVCFLSTGSLLWYSNRIVAPFSQHFSVKVVSA